MTARERGSRLRQEILRRRDRLDTLLQRLQATGPLIAGSVYDRKRRCGKPGCRCLEGRLHADRVLAIRRAGRTAVRALDPMEDEPIEDGVAAWRGFRRDRQELGSACRELLETVDRLGRARLRLPSGSR
jgi:hypothetical protein